MAEAVMFQREWVIEINEILKDRTPKVGGIMRVATLLLEVKREAYTPEFFSFGPYHHSKLEKDTESSRGERKISTAEAYKGKSAVTLSQKLRNHGKNFNSIIEMMEAQQAEIGHFYHWPASKECEYAKNFALMMALDSCFLLRFLFSLMRFRYGTKATCGGRCPSPDDDMIRLCPFQVCIKCDILKLENQIPLSVMKIVFEYAKEALIFDDRFQHFSELLQKTCLVLSPFSADDLSNDNDSKVISEAVEKEPHLLGCMHAFVSPFLQMETDQKWSASTSQILKDIILCLPFLSVNKFLDMLLPSLTNIERKFTFAVNAKSLADAGIKFGNFKANSEPAMKIGFDKVTSTLYLPTINLWQMHTEVLLRNLIALEFNDPTRTNSVMRYVGLMDCLIQSSADVRVLRDHYLITTNTLTDESVATMWTSLCQPFFTGDCDLGPADEIGEALSEVLMKNYYKSKIKRMLLGIVDYVSSWKFMASLGVFLGLVMTAVQTYCNLYQYYHSDSCSNNNSNHTMHH